MSEGVGCCVCGREREREQVGDEEVCTLVCVCVCVRHIHTYIHTLLPFLGMCAFVCMCVYVCVCVCQHTYLVASPWHGHVCMCVSIDDGKSLSLLCLFLLGWLQCPTHGVGRKFPPFSV